MSGLRYRTCRAHHTPIRARQPVAVTKGAHRAFASQGVSLPCSNPEVDPWPQPLPVTVTPSTARFALARARPPTPIRCGGSRTQCPGSLRLRICRHWARPFEGATTRFEETQPERRVGGAVDMSKCHRQHLWHATQPTAQHVITCVCTSHGFILASSSALTHRVKRPAGPAVE